MKSAALNRIITVEQKTISSSPSGETIETWTDLLIDEPAEFIPLRGAERFALRQTVGTSIGTFVLRFHPEITVLSRVQYDNKTWDVIDVREVGRGDGTELDVAARSDLS
jgi:SPP1 family predicted phage head-tail adaptor